MSSSPKFNTFSVLLLANASTKITLKHYENLSESYVGRPPPPERLTDWHLTVLVFIINKHDHHGTDRQPHPQQNSTGFRRKWDKSHRPARIGPGTSTGMCYNTILEIPVHFGWYLSNRFLHVEKARTYSKLVKISPNVGT